MELPRDFHRIIVLAHGTPMGLRRIFHVVSMGNRLPCVDRAGPLGLPYVQVLAGP